MKNNLQASTKKLLLFFLPLLIYSLVSIILFGKNTIGHLDTYLVRGSVNDSGSFIWFFNWLPYAFTHKLNFFLTKVIWVPTGFNLAQATFVPLLGLLTLPLTLHFGPIVSFNLLAIFGSALSAWTAYILCNYITKSFSSSLFGGYFFGFSFYQIYFLSYADINITCVFLIPILVFLALLYFDKKIQTLSFTLLTILCLVCQFLISIEIFTTYGLFAFSLWLVAFKVCKDRRHELLNCALYTIIAYVISSIIVSPYIYYFFKTPLPSKFMDTLIHLNSIANFIIPPKEALFHFKLIDGFGNHFRPGYLGLPLIVVLILFMKEFWRTRKGKILTLSFVIPTIFSMGFGLQVYYRHDLIPHYLFPLPGMILHYIPILMHALPSRFIMYSTLAIAIIVAIWLAAKKDFFRYTMIIISMIVLLPTLETVYWSTKVPLPPFISQGLYKKWLTPNEVVMILPFSYWGYDMLWQVYSGMYFRQVGGFASAFFPGKFNDDPTVATLMYKKSIDAKSPILLKDFIKTHHINSILISEGSEQFWKKLMMTLGVKPIQVGSVTIYKISN